MENSDLLCSLSEKLISGQKYPKLMVTFQDKESNLSMYFVTTKKIIEKINGKFFILTLIILVYLLLSSFGFQSYLAKDLVERPYKNKRFLTDFEAIHIHASNVNYLCLQATMSQTIFNYKYNFDRSILPQRWYKNQILKLQETTQIVSKYNDKIYET